MSFTVKFDKAACAARIKDAAEGRALLITSEQVLKDCNYYCKQDQSGLINSSITHSQPEKGRLIWKTPYARKQYYLKSASIDVNPNASWMWCNKAKARWGKRWLEIYDRAFKEDLSRR